MEKKIYKSLEFNMLVLTACFALVSVWQFINIRRELPDAVEWYKEEGFAFSGVQLESLAGDERVGFYVEAAMPVMESVLGVTEETPVRYADAEYLELSGMEPEAGQWPQDGTQAAVSEDWALEHYKYLDVTGQTLQVNGKTYTICGVYRTDNSWRQKLSDDGRECIYFSAADGNLAQGMVPHYLYFRKTGGDFSVNREHLQDIAAEITGERVVPDVSLDVESAAHVFMQNLFIGFLLWLLLTLGHFLYRTRNVMQFVLAAVLVLAVILYRWYIPMGYLPENNVFAFGEYAKQYMEAQGLRHRYGETGYFGNLVYIHVWISWTVLTLQGLAFVWNAMWLVVGKMKRRFIRHGNSACSRRGTL